MTKMRNGLENGLANGLSILAYFLGFKQWKSCFSVQQGIITPKPAVISHDPDALRETLILIVSSSFALPI